jgi:hypothetical protein
MKSRIIICGCSYYSLHQMLVKLLFDSDPSNNAFCTDSEYDILS